MSKPDVHLRLYGPAPKQSDAPSSGQVLRQYISSHVPAGDRKNLDDDLKKVWPLLKEGDKTSKKLTRRGQAAKKGLFQVNGNQKRKGKGKLLSSQQRRVLAVDRLPKRGGIKYADLLPINALWLDYIKGLVADLDKVDEQAKIKLCRADYHGGLVKVSKSACASNVGLEGLVAAETKGTFVLVGKDDVARTVPKKNAAFTFRVDQHVFTVSGNSMIMRPSERASKKWKSKGPLDF